MYKTSNPALGERAVTRMLASAGVGSRTMTIEGTATKTMILLVMAMVSAGFVWSAYFGGNKDAAEGAATVGAIGGLVFALVTIFVPRLSPWTAPLYAVLEGMLLGGLSAMFEAVPGFEGITLQAVGLTLGTLFTLLLAYRSGLIRATENFRLGVTAATGGIALYYLASFVGGFFGFQMPLIHQNDGWGIGFSLFVVVIAALNYVLDFDFIERAAESGADKRMEWYGAFSLLMTTIWLYLELLRLLAKLRSDD